MLKKIINIIKPLLPKNKIMDEIKWRLKNKPVPPPHFIKQRIIKGYAKKFAIKEFIETGTYLGSTVEALKNVFNKIYSVEIDRVLFEKAQDRFINSSHIKILQGDSSKVLPSILEKLNTTALFYLDGHYSGGDSSKGDQNTPILRELELILNHKIKNHVILIDDARCFTGKDDYPTLIEVQSFLKNVRPELIFQIRDDIIRILP